MYDFRFWASKAIKFFIVFILWPFSLSRPSLYRHSSLFLVQIQTKFFSVYIGVGAISIQVMGFWADCGKRFDIPPPQKVMSVIYKQTEEEEKTKKHLLLFNSIEFLCKCVLFRFVQCRFSIRVAHPHTHSYGNVFTYSESSHQEIMNTNGCSFCSFYDVCR